MKGAIALVFLGAVAASPVPAPQLGALKKLLEGLSGNDSPGEVNGDYEQAPYEVLQKLDVSLSLTESVLCLHFVTSRDTKSDSTPVSSGSALNQPMTWRKRQRRRTMMVTENSAS